MRSKFLDLTCDWSEVRRLDLHRYWRDEGNFALLLSWGGAHSLPMWCLDLCLPLWLSYLIPEGWES